MGYPSGYLDAASSEPLHPVARDTLLPALDAGQGEGYADPRRLHLPARGARLLLDNARAVVADCLGVRPDEVTFTSSGTRAVHLGVLGLLAGAGTGAHLGYTAVEHAAVRHAAAWHERLGGTSTELGVDALGRVGDAPAGLDVLAVQTANHEVGTVQPVADLGGIVFTDACASMGRLALPDGWSAAAGSAHKWGGPAGVGVLLVRKGARWRQPLPGDDRIDERAAGFENVPAALAAAAALRAAYDEAAERNARQHELIDRIREVAAAIPDTDVVGDPVDRLPHLVTFSCLYVDGEALVSALDAEGFGVASGSACAASTLEPSAVLAAMGALTHGNVRVSLTRDTTAEEVERFCAVLPRVVARLRDDMLR